MWRKMLLVIVLVVVSGSACFAADLPAMTDKVYNAVAEIIERGDVDPRQTLSLIDVYFEENASFIAEIRAETKKMMDQAAPMMAKMMNKYSSMSEAELERLEQQGSGQAQMQSNMSPAMIRYNKAVEAFSTDHPRYALQLAGKMMQLISVPQGSGRELYRGSGYEQQRGSGYEQQRGSGYEQYDEEW